MASPNNVVEQETSKEDENVLVTFNVDEDNLETQKKSAEFSKGDIVDEGTQDNIGEEIEDNEKEKVNNDSNNTSGPLSRNQIQESIEEVDEFDQYDVSSYIPNVWKKYDNNDILFLDKFETKAFASEILDKVDEKMPIDSDF